MPAEKRSGVPLADDTTSSQDAPEPEGAWTRSTPNFWLGIITTVLVVVAWSTNLVSKPLATAFGGSVTVLGMLIAYLSYRKREKKGHVPAGVVTTGVEAHLPESLLAVLTANNAQNSAIIEAAVHNRQKSPVVFLYIGEHTMDGEPELLELVIPHLEDMQAREVFGQAKKAAQNMKVDSRFVYRHNRREAIHNVWQHIEPYDTIVAAEQAKSIWGVTPDSLEYEHVPEGEVAHLHKAWSRQASHSPIP